MSNQVFLLQNQLAGKWIWFHVKMFELSQYLSLVAQKISQAARGIVKVSILTILLTR